MVQWGGSEKLKVRSCGVAFGDDCFILDAGHYACGEIESGMTSGAGWCVVRWFLFGGFGLVRWSLVNRVGNELPTLRWIPGTAGVAR